MVTIRQSTHDLLFFQLQLNNLHSVQLGLSHSVHHTIELNTVKFMSDIFVANLIS